MGTAPLLGNVLSIGICILIRFGPEMHLTNAFEHSRYKLNSAWTVSQKHHFDFQCLRILIMLLNEGERFGGDLGLTFSSKQDD